MGLSSVRPHILGPASASATGAITVVPLRPIGGHRRLTAPRSSVTTAASSHSRPGCLLWMKTSSNCPHHGGLRKRKSVANVAIRLVSVLKEPTEPDVEAVGSIPFLLGGPKRDALEAKLAQPTTSRIKQPAPAAPTLVRWNDVEPHDVSNPPRFVVGVLRRSELAEPDDATVLDQYKDFAAEL
jgi:hypothetical protein